MPHSDIQPLYKALVSKTEDVANKDLKGDQTSDRLSALAVACRGFLSTLDRQELISKVPNKSYFMFSDRSRKKTSRPVNSLLYDLELDISEIKKILKCEMTALSPEKITRCIYTLAASYCCSSDILNISDQKTPGTFFEFLIGHLVAHALGANPEKQIRVPTLDMDITIPTDFVFDLGTGKNRVHLPIKLSTRERVVQVWAHQRVLDGMHGTARFKGILVVMGETNKQKDVSVTEVCLPNQWMAYQMYIAQLFRIYYLDIPEKYMALKCAYPFIQVKAFGEFFSEISKIERSGVE